MWPSTKIEKYLMLPSFPPPVCLSTPTLGMDADSVSQDKHAVAWEEVNVLIDLLKLGLIFWHDLRSG
jgi:hypothetical protein